MKLNPEDFIRPSITEDCWYLGPKLRLPDQEECHAGGVSPVPALIAGVMYGACTYTALDPATMQPGAMFGVMPTSQPKEGKVWMLGSDAVERNAHLFLRGSKIILNKYLFGDYYDLLYNYTYVKNTLHHDWLKWLGFTFFRKVELTPGNEFYEFAKLRG